MIRTRTRNQSILKPLGNNKPTDQGFRWWALSLPVSNPCAGLTTLSTISFDKHYRRKHNNTAGRRLLDGYKAAYWFRLPEWQFRRKVKPGRNGSHRGENSLTSGQGMPILLSLDTWRFRATCST